MSERRACEHVRFSEPCTHPAVFTVSAGRRKHDAQDSCRRHLAETVEMLTALDTLGEERDVDVIVRRVR